MTSPLPTYRIDGPPGAPLLILANSLGTTIDLWDAQLPVLTERHRVLRYEHPGHGGSATPNPLPATIADLGAAVVGLLDELDEPRASVCGVSLGGMVATWLATHHPDRVDRLVLACTSAHLPPASAWLDRAAAVRAADDGVGSLLDGLMGRWFTPGYETRAPGIRGRVAAMLAAADPAGYAACCEAIGAMDQRPDLAAIVAPTLVVAGADDPVTPPAMALELAAGIAGASLVVLAGAAHLANIEQAGRFTAAVVDHLSGTALERGDRTRRAVLGDAHVERAAATPGALRAPFTDLITRTAWGDVWTRPGLDRPTRSAITLAALTSVGAWDELALHVRGARRNGLTVEEIGEILLHTAIYAGVPAANTALGIAQRVLAEMGDAGAGG